MRKGGSRRLKYRGCETNSTVLWDGWPGGANRANGASGRDCFHDGVGGSGGDDASEPPARGGKQGAELFFGALAAAGENQHLKIEEFGGREIVAGVDDGVN